MLWKSRAEWRDGSSFTTLLKLKCKSNRLYSRPGPEWWFVFISLQCQWLWADAQIFNKSVTNTFPMFIIPVIYFSYSWHLFFSSLCYKWLISGWTELSTLTNHTSKNKALKKIYPSIFLTAFSVQGHRRAVIYPRSKVQPGLLKLKDRQPVTPTGKFSHQLT